MKKWRRFLAPLLCAAILMGTMAGCNSGTDPAGGGSNTNGQGDGKQEIVVYNWGEYISDGADGSLDVIKQFEKETGIKVNYQMFASNEEMYAKLKSGATGYDVIIPSDYMIARMIEEDMLQKLDFANIPNYQYIMDDFKDGKLDFDPKNEYSVPYTWGTVGIIYNKTMVKEPVDSWNILWSEKYKDNILMFNNSRDAFGIAEKKLGFSQNTTNTDELNKAAEELKKQKPVVQAYVMDEIFDKMQNGEAALAPYYAGDAITMMNENPDLAFAIPKEGTNRFVDSMVVPKDSKNKALAEKFIDFMCRKDIAKANAEYIGYSTPQKQTMEELDPELKNNKIAYPDEATLANCESFKNLPQQALKLMEDRWLEIKTK